MPVQIPELSIALHCDYHESMLHVMCLYLSICAEKIGFSHIQATLNPMHSRISLVDLQRSCSSVPLYLLLCKTAATAYNKENLNTLVSLSVQYWVQEAARTVFVFAGPGHHAETEILSYHISVVYCSRVLVRKKTKYIYSSKELSL